jgi:predicted ArsR family transcriptional regulator
MTDFARTHARADDLDTAQSSAARAETMAQRQAAAIYTCLQVYGPQTSDQIAQHINLLPHQVIKRVSDLRNADAIVDTGERRRTRTGRPAAVWKIKPSEAAE